MININGLTHQHDRVVLISIWKETIGYHNDITNKNSWLMLVDDFGYFGYFATVLTYQVL